MQLLQNEYHLLNKNFCVLALIKKYVEFIKCLFFLNISIGESLESQSYIAIMTTQIRTTFVHEINYYVQLSTRYKNKPAL